MLASAAVFLFLLAGCSRDAPAFKSIDITGADFAKDFELADQTGQVRHLADFRGKVVVMFFGYTQCPDVCPTTMAEMVEVKRQLGADANKLQVIFVTLDPERDTPSMLKAYVENFDPNFLALVPKTDQLVSLTKDYKIYFKKVPTKDGQSYTLDHSAGSYVYDKEGHIRLMMTYGRAIQDQISDIRLLL